MIRLFGMIGSAILAAVALGLVAGFCLWIYSLWSFLGSCYPPYEDDSYVEYKDEDFHPASRPMISRD